MLGLFGWAHAYVSLTKNSSTPIFEISFEEKSCATGSLCGAKICLNGECNAGGKSLQLVNTENNPKVVDTAVNLFRIQCATTPTEVESSGAVLSEFGNPVILSNLQVSAAGEQYILAAVSCTNYRSRANGKFCELGVTRWETKSSTGHVSSGACCNEDIGAEDGSGSCQPSIPNAAPEAVIIADTSAATNTEQVLESIQNTEESRVQPSTFGRSTLVENVRCFFGGTCGSQYEIPDVPNSPEANQQSTENAAYGSLESPTNSTVSTQETPSLRERYVSLFNKSETERPTNESTGANENYSPPTEAPVRNFVQGTFPLEGNTPQSNELSFTPGESNPAFDSETPLLYVAEQRLREAEQAAREAVRSNFISKAQELAVYTGLMDIENTNFAAEYEELQSARRAHAEALLAAQRESPALRQAQQQVTEAQNQVREARAETPLLRQWAAEVGFGDSPDALASAQSNLEGATANYERALADYRGHPANIAQTPVSNPPASATAYQPLPNGPYETSVNTQPRSSVGQVTQPLSYPPLPQAKPLPPTPSWSSQIQNARTLGDYYAAIDQPVPSTAARRSFAAQLGMSQTEIDAIGTAQGNQDFLRTLQNRSQQAVQQPYVPIDTNTPSSVQSNSAGRTAFSSTAQKAQNLSSFFAAIGSENTDLYSRDSRAQLFEQLGLGLASSYQRTAAMNAQLLKAIQKSCWLNVETNRLTCLR